MKIKVDGDLKRTFDIDSKSATAFKNIIVYATSPWYTEVYGKIRNLIISSKSGSKPTGTYNLLHENPY